jgi:hypothetical protein
MGRQGEVRTREGKLQIAPRPDIAVYGIASERVEIGCNRSQFNSVLSAPAPHLYSNQSNRSPDLGCHTFGVTLNIKVGRSMKMAVWLADQ